MGSYAERRIIRYLWKKSSIFTTVHNRKKNRDEKEVDHFDRSSSMWEDPSLYDME